MARLNFFCDVDSLNFLLKKNYDQAKYRDMEISMDLIELPLYFIYSFDDESWITKAYQRGQLYTHDGSGVFCGEIIVNRKTQKGQIKSTQELNENMTAFYAACKKLSFFAQDENLDEVSVDFDPEKEGVKLYVEDGELKYKVVSGKARPDMMVLTLLGETTMGRPYMDDFMTNSWLEMASFEEKLEAAEDGDADAMHNVAMAYLNGDDDVEQDPEKALFWMEKAAEKGETLSAFNTGLFYAKGYGTKRNLEKAAEWMEKAAAEGDDDAKTLGPKFRQAIADTIAAENGDAFAQGRLARFYMELAGALEQSGTDEYFKESVKWAMKAAKQDNGEGFWALALAYEHGRGVEANVKTAIECYEKGAKLGHARCLNSLGAFYLRGDSIKQNMKLGYELILRSSLLGDGEAMANLGRCYQFGSGCMGSMKRAMFWYKKSLELVPNDDLERKVAVFETLPGAEEEYAGEDSNRILTTGEKALLDKIDAVLPEDVRESVKHAAHVTGEYSDNSEIYDEDELDDLPAGYMDALEAFMEAEEYENELAEAGVLQKVTVPGKESIKELRLKEEKKKQEELKRKRNHQFNNWEEYDEIEAEEKIEYDKDSQLLQKLKKDYRETLTKDSSKRIEERKAKIYKEFSERTEKLSEEKKKCERELENAGFFAFGLKKNLKEKIYSLSTQLSEQTMESLNAKYNEAVLKEGENTREKICEYEQKLNNLLLKKYPYSDLDHPKTQGRMELKSASQEEYRDYLQEAYRYLVKTGGHKTWGEINQHLKEIGILEEREWQSSGLTLIDLYYKGKLTTTQKLSAIFSQCESLKYIAQKVEYEGLKRHVYYDVGEKELNSPIPKYTRYTIRDSRIDFQNVPKK